MTTCLEWWRDSWWLWTLVNGEPVSFVKLDPRWAPSPPVLR